MSTSELFVYALVGLVLFMYVRKFMMTRAVTNYSAADLAERMGNRGEIVVLDVRTRGERQNSQIRGSVHIPLQELSSRIGELEQHRSKEIVCYCQSGNRSVTAAYKLHKLGFQAANLKGGIAEWNFQNR